MIVIVGWGTCARVLFLALGVLQREQVRSAKTAFAHKNSSFIRSHPRRRMCLQHMLLVLPNCCHRIDHPGNRRKNSVPPGISDYG